MKIRLDNLIIILLILALTVIAYDVAKADYPDINWYGIRDNKSVIEVCYKNGECHRVVHKNESIEKDIIKKWIDDITKIHDSIEERHERAKDSSYK